VNNGCTFARKLNCHLPTEGWSDWKRAMVPPQTGGKNLPPRGRNQVGFICLSIEDAFSDQDQYCGIYEWQARNQHKHVVYVGSTCRRKGGSLKDRIREYCRNGSHKKRSH